MADAKQHKLSKTLALAEWTATELPIRFFGDPVLYKACRPFSADEFGGSEMEQLAGRLTDAFKKYRVHTQMGQGLAANQIGSDRSMIVVLIGSDPTIMVNPESVNLGGKGSYMECCISSGSMLVGNVIRPWNGTFKYKTLAGQEQTLEPNPLQTRVLLHELDHIKGESCVDKYEPGTMAIVLDGVNELRRYRLIEL